jgi:hypothetical protein
MGLPEGRAASRAVLGHECGELRARLTQDSALFFPVPRCPYEKIRRIIDEWETGVKRKISLSFKGIIGVARSAESAGGELRIELCQLLTHRGAEGCQFIQGGGWGFRHWLGEDKREAGIGLDGLDTAAR